MTLIILVNSSHEVTLDMEMLSDSSPASNFKSNLSTKKTIY